MDILKEIFNGDYEVPTLPKQDLTAWLEKNYAFWERLERTLGAKATEELWFQRNELEEDLRFGGFQAGFPDAGPLLLKRPYSTPF